MPTPNNTDTDNLDVRIMNEVFGVATYTALDAAALGNRLEDILGALCPRPGAQRAAARGGSAALRAVEAADYEKRHPGAPGFYFQTWPGPRPDYANHWTLPLPVPAFSTDWGAAMQIRDWAAQSTFHWAMFAVELDTIIRARGAYPHVGTGADLEGYGGLGSRTLGGFVNLLRVVTPTDMAKAALQTVAAIEEMLAVTPDEIEATNKAWASVIGVAAGVWHCTNIVAAKEDAE